MARAFVRSVVLWTLVAYLAIALFEAIVFGRLEPTRYVPGAVGAGLGITAADRLSPLRFSRS
ncbi:hypothetical protein [Natronorubrum aibiense]|uniref:Uncharacterized protein n=1 Tax=Natronorubrum aibiense TaxID=348826 RepID=A0A5P9P5C4_9EURY|nr:hypothetical protein [Natronorubrum aibiense]QFU83332.1 hypothetical protein GCU68_12685 [Natronorubrum aibiense]